MSSDYISNFWEKMLAINLPTTISSFNGDSLYIIIKPILSFKEIMGIKTKLPFKVYSPNDKDVFSLILISLASIICKY